MLFPFAMIFKVGYIWIYLDIFFGRHCLNTFVVLYRLSNRYRVPFVSSIHFLWVKVIKVLSSLCH